MSAITWVNVALHALVLSVLGWLLVKWCVKDARHRAWASLIALGVVITAPFLMELEWPDLPRFPAKESAPTVETVSWKPDWRISTSVVSRVESLPVIEDGPSAASVVSMAFIASWICAVWALGVVITGLRHVFLSFMAWRWRRSLRCLSAEEEKKVSAHMKSGSLRVLEVQGSPCVVGLWRPVIAVPQDIIGKWKAQQWRWLLNHEGEHLRSRDTMVAWLLGWSKVCLWWNPFVYALIEQWAQAREEICDHVAVESGAHDEAVAYASFLLNIAAASRLSSPAMLHMAASLPARRLRARMIAMLNKVQIRKTASSWFLCATVTMMASLAALVSCVGLKTEKIPTKGPPELITQTYKVAPDFFLNAAGKRVAAKEMLMERGVAFPEGATATFVPGARQLVVRNTRVNLDRLEAEVSLIKLENEARNTQIYITSKWVEIDTTQVSSKQDPAVMEMGKITEDGAILTEAQYQTVIRALSQRKGVHLLSAPSVTTKIGQRAIVEVVREFYSREASIAVAKGDKTATFDLVGPRTELLAEVKGGKIQLDIRATLGCLDERDPDNLCVQYLRKNKSALLGNTESIVLRMGEEPTKAGHEVLLFMTATWIDPTGKALGEQEAIDRALRLEALDEKAKKAEPSATSNVQDLYFKGFLAWKKGGELADKGNKEEARKKLEEACQILRRVQEQNPSWQKDIVAFRLKKTGEALAALGFDLPKEAVDEKVQLPQIPITVEVKTVELRHGPGTDVLSLLMQNISTQPAPQPETPAPVPPEKGVESPLIPAIPPGVYTVAGVFTSEQYASLTKVLGERKGAKVIAYPSVEGMSGRKVIVPQKEEEQRLFSTTVEPVVGPDGYTIDLNIQISDHRFPTTSRQTSVTTSITLWDGQTVALGGLVSDDPKEKLSRLVFITAKMDKAKQK